MEEKMIARSGTVAGSVHFACLFITIKLFLNTYSVVFIAINKQILTTNLKSFFILKPP